MKKLALLFSIIVLASGVCLAQTSGFTYQGKLADAGVPATGPYDLTFRLFPIVSGGAQIGADVVRDDVQVTNGVFTVSLDFGSSPFTSDTARYLEIAVRPGASTGAYTTLVPRQPITSSPYSVSTIRAASADVATNALQLGGVTASQYVQTADARLSDARTPTAGSTNYIQNTTAQQAGTNFNVSGNGTVGGTLTSNIVNATTQYNLGGSRVLSNSVALGNLIAGVGAGHTATGVENAFFGASSGEVNATGSTNSFFGAFSGQANTTSSDNSFFGAKSGRITTGRQNSFFGSGSGEQNTTGIMNSFFGSFSGFANHGGVSNVFVGSDAGQSNLGGSSNTFIGADSGLSNVNESNNTFLGYKANGAAAITNATAIGVLTSVTQSNSLVLGSINTVNGATADTNVGIGTTAPTEKLQVKNGNIRWSNSILQSDQGGTIELGGTSTMAGSGVPYIDFHFNGLTEDYNVRLINDSPGQLSVLGNLSVTGKVQVNTLGAAGSTSLCRNASSEISTCSSSLRYKTNIKPFSNGLILINRLHPIAFNWKDGGMKDVGFGAEDVERISPLLVTYNSTGQVEGVKYDRLSVIFVNAFKEQQLQLDRKDTEIEALKSENAALNTRLNKIERMIQEFKNAPASRAVRPGPRRVMSRQTRAVSR